MGMSLTADPEDIDHYLSSIQDNYGAIMES